MNEWQTIDTYKDDLVLVTWIDEEGFRNYSLARKRLGIQANVDG
jgi:hypothetical protein